MSKWIYYLKKHALKFGCIGLLNTVTQQVVYLGLIGWGCYYLFAQILSFLVALMLSFVLNSQWNYQVELSLRSAYLFLMANLPSWGIQSISLWVLVQRIDVPEQLALLLTLMVTVPVSFICVTFNMLRQHKNKKGSYENSNYDKIAMKDIQ